MLYMIEFGGNNDASVMASIARPDINWPLILCIHKDSRVPIAGSGSTTSVTAAHLAKCQEEALER